MVSTTSPNNPISDLAAILRRDPHGRRLAEVYLESYFEHLSLRESCAAHLHQRFSAQHIPVTRNSPVLRLVRPPEPIARKRKPVG